MSGGDTDGVDDDDPPRPIHTTLTNPGISDRIEQDVPGFVPYGFGFERDAVGRGILRSVPLALPLCRSAALCSTPDDVGGDSGGNPGFDACRPIPGYHHLWVDVPSPSLVPTVGPFLRTLVRLTEGVDPRTLRVCVSFDWQSRSGVDRAAGAEDAEAKAAAHHVHMLVRNSMGAALFLTSLAVLLPGGVESGQVRAVMEGNADVGYPTVGLMTRKRSESDGGDGCDASSSGTDLVDAAAAVTTTERSASSRRQHAGEGRSSPPVVVNDYLHLSGREGNDVSVRITARTRMCTVRLTPVLYHLARALRERGEVISEEGTTTGSSSTEDFLPSLPLLPSVSEPRHCIEPQLNVDLLACVDKVANLYRIIMLVRDYRSIDKLVLVVRDEATCRRFATETNKFIRGLDKTDGGGDRKGCEGDSVPRVVTIQQAVNLLAQINDTDDSDCCVVAVDLHENALTLGDDEDGSNGLLRRAGAVIWGFEKDGIPPPLLSLTAGYVQVRCRSSLNLVAAMSIVLHHWAGDAAFYDDGAK